MSLRPSAQYTQQNNLRQKNPIYIFQLGAVGDGTVVPAISQEFASGHVFQATKTRANLISSIQGGGSSISPLAGNSSISQIQVSVEDREAQVTKLFTTYPMKNRVCTLKAGYAEIPESQYITVFRGLLDDVSIMTGGDSVTFSIIDFSRLTKATVCNNEVTLTQDMLAGDMTMTVSSSSFFPPNTSGSGELGDVYFIVVDGEVMSYTSISAPGAFPQVFQIRNRGEFGTTPNAHNAGATIDNFVVLDGNPLTIYLRLLMSVNGDGTNGPYDVYGSGIGAAIPQSYVDVKGIEFQRDAYLPVGRMTFYINKPTDVKKFTEDEIFMVINGYPVILWDGRLSVKIYTVPFPTLVASSFSDSNIVTNPMFTLGLQSNQSFFNEVDISYDYDPIQDSFKNEALVVNSDSYVATQEEAVLTIQSKGLRSGNLFGADKYIRKYAANIFKRYSKGAPNIQAEVHYSQHLLSVGDFVQVSSAGLPDYATRGRGGNGFICEIINKTMNWTKGTVQYQMLATGINVSNKYWIIGPAGAPNYLSASAAQRQYGYIGKKLSDLVGVQSDGSPGTYISP